MPMVQVDVHTHRQFAVVTAALAGILVALFLHVVSLGPHAAAFLQAHGAQPGRLRMLIHWRHPYDCLDAAIAIVSSLFLHANWGQLAVSVVLLLLFGASVEDRLSHSRFLGLFVLGGATAVLAQTYFGSNSELALIGSSAGVSAVAGGSLAISPRGSVPTMIRGFEFPWLLGPIAWIFALLLLEVMPLPMPAGIAAVTLPFLVLAYVVGIAAAPLLLRSRPNLLRG